jgi:predicted phosphodiesterase
MKKILYIVMALVLSACSRDMTLDILGMFSPQGETVKTRFEQSMEYNAQAGFSHLDMQSDDYLIYVCSDSHITRKTHRCLDYFMEQYKAAPSPKMALHLGDLIDAQDNFPCADSILHFAGQTAQDTVFVTVGNHDIYFKQWSIYRSIFKTSVYWFDTHNGGKKLDLFICIDTGEGTLGDAQMKWLEQLLAEKSQEGYRHIIVFTHTHQWKLDGSQEHASNYALEDTYAMTDLFGKYKVDYVWSGHQHARQSVIYKEVNYLVLDSAKDGEPGHAYMTVNMGNSIIYHYHSFPKEN